MIVARFKAPVIRPGLTQVHVLLGISMGQYYLCGDYFAAFVKLINAYRPSIKKLTLVPTGDLKRYVIQLEQPQLAADKVEVLARQLNEVWLQEQKRWLEQLIVPLEIIPWEKFRLTNTFQASFALTSQEYLANAVFQKYVNELAEKYSLRTLEHFSSIGVKTKSEDCFHAMKCYCMEESSMYAEFIRYGVNTQIYPGKWNKAMEHMYKKYAPTDPMPWIEFRFNV